MDFLQHSVAEQKKIIKIFDVDFPYILNLLNIFSILFLLSIV